MGGRPAITNAASAAVVLYRRATRTASLLSTCRKPYLSVWPTWTDTPPTRTQEGGGGPREGSENHMASVFWAATSRPSSTSSAHKACGHLRKRTRFSPPGGRGNRSILSNARFHNKGPSTDPCGTPRSIGLLTGVDSRFALAEAKLLRLKRRVSFTNMLDEAARDNSLENFAHLI
ncbi:hypothetical protein PUN28_000528 [Cardiocondyla obscurior]|uniref:Uncharacterized protein n=1 Tax=Cardiocondyla obscurior TaxID=286306 RepID=A0AAW2H0B9_9HYME